MNISCRYMDEQANEETWRSRSTNVRIVEKQIERHISSNAFHYYQ